jgi:aspartate/methionine/tyrosine aminotransferase
VWLNSPSNPTGAVLDAHALRAVVEWGRRHGVLVASDECYYELGWEAEPVSVLDPAVCGDSADGVLGAALAVQAQQPRRLPRGVRRR